MKSKTYIEAFSEIEVGDYVEIIVTDSECYNLNVGRVIQGVVVGIDDDCMIDLDRMNTYPEAEGDITEYKTFNFVFIWEEKATMTLTKGVK